MISRFGLLVVVVAVLLGSSIAVDTLRHNRVGALATTPKDEGTRFFDQEVRPRVDEELADNDLIIRRHYVVEREYYNVWVTQTVFILVSRAFGIEMATLRDPQLAAAALTDAKAEALAWAMYETRHYLRIKIREREEQRKCMKLLVAFMRYRDRKAYGNPDGPTWDWLLERKLRKYDVKVQQDQPIDKRISLDIIFSAAAPNDFVNAFIEWVASKTGGTMTQEERENLMRNAGISQEDVDELKKMSERVVCPKQKESDSQLPNEALAFDFALSHPEMKEIQGDIEMEQPLLTRIPSSGDVKRKNPQ